MHKVFNESEERYEFHPNRGPVCTELQDQTRVCSLFQRHQCHRAVSPSPEPMGGEQVTQGIFLGILTVISKGKRQ